MTRNSRNTTRSSDLCDDPTEGLVMRQVSVLRLQEEGPCGERPQRQLKIDVLPDNALLEIFDFYREDPTSIILSRFSWKWKPLTQVCRRWRRIIFESPRRLDLQVVCTATTPTRTLLDIWPLFPITVYCNTYLVDEKDIENITTALEHRDRTSKICFHDVNGSALLKMATSTVMNEPHPLLTEFRLASTDAWVLWLPETFLGGSAPPRLLSFVLEGIPFPTLHKFILSATDIARLGLVDIPVAGYIAPEEMATCLAALPNLEDLAIEFRSPLYFQIGLPLLTPAVLPSLTDFSFKGASEYFEDLLARTYTPQLNQLNILFFKDFIFDLPQLRSLLVRGEGLRPHSLAWVEFDVQEINITLGSPPRIMLTILCEEWDRQLSSLAQVCNQDLPVLSSVEQLTVYVYEPRLSSLSWRDDMDSLPWLQLFLPFIAVRDLYVSEQLVPFVIAALKGFTGERSMDVLPALNRLFLEGFQPSGYLKEAIEPFVSSRQLSDHPVVIQSEQPPPVPNSHLFQTL